ncbi:hypothetical protein CYLTODRAFT_418991 [Cylindrobasidium torrendii FP15055 ss-10]|uniref:Transmembrane protein n=1 Tax=Cylindrobasidium torrendii FP15055 ss-10 TaxID=1314674 RepID=A0A0D7BNZ8_9AGAR|nr:hypothetical protein CYLTODRAFT_418991 [Cylindrobasidium torrendii FP15055 ss-10]
MEADANPALESVPEDLDIECENDLVRFDYRRHVLLYTLIVPLVTLLTFALGTIPFWFTHLSLRIDEFLVPLSVWALSYALQRQVGKWEWWHAAQVIRAAIHVVLLLSVPNLLHTAHYAEHPLPSKHDTTAFLRTWLVGLVWAFAEAVVSIRSAYQSIALYAPQPPKLPEDDDDEDADEESVLSTNLSLLGHLHKRDLLEEAFGGVAFIDIQFFILALQRVSSVLLSIGMTLLLTATWYPTVGRVYCVLVLVGCWAVQATIGLLRTPEVRVYVGLILGVGVFFAGLGVWGILE